MAGGMSAKKKTKASARTPEKSLILVASNRSPVVPWVAIRWARYPLPHLERPPMKFLSALISQGSASIGGATFSKNRGGNYIRKRVAPVQPLSLIHI